MVRSGKKSRVKVGAIAALDKDLQLALGAKTIRIEAPVPGKGFVGVEVPNDEASLVCLRDVMESKQFQKINSPLAIALGQSVDGAPVAAEKLPRNN
jgi:S-DNA-T family DNA segregation ATPase FtsK/SpoIIIE